MQYKQILRRSARLDALTVQLEHLKPGYDAAKDAPWWDKAASAKKQAYREVLLKAQLVRLQLEQEMTKYLEQEKKMLRFD